MLAKAFTIWIFCALQLVSVVIGGGLAGAFEKIYFWRAYNIAWAWYGSSQKYILPVGRARGSLPNGQLNFQEFMQAITGRWDCTVTEPNPGDDLLPVAQELEQQGFGQSVQAQKCDAHLQGQSGYVTLIQRMSELVENAQAAAGDLPDLKSAVDDGLYDMVEATDYIRRIRISENDPYVIRDIQNKFPGINVAVTTETDEKLGLSWQRLDLDTTIQQNPSLSGDSREDFKAWVANYGVSAWNEQNPGEPTQTDGSISHYAVLQSWKYVGVSLKSCFIDSI